MKNKSSDQKILVLDIETAPIEAFVWGLFDQNIGIDFIKNDWSILSYAAKWVGSKKIIYADTGGRGVRKVRDDKILMRPLWDLLDAADIVIGQNLRKFDAKKVNAKMIAHGLGPPSPYKVVDTLLVSRKHFAFTSNKLAFTSRLLTDTPKDEHKRFAGFELWKECLADNPAAWREMKKYNKRDVVATEKLYLKLRPWIAGHPSVSVHEDPESPTCPHCDSSKMQRRGVSVLRAGGSYPRFQCQGCGAWSRGKTLLRTTASSKKQLVSIT